MSRVERAAVFVTFLRVLATLLLVVGLLGAATIATDESYVRPGLGFAADITVAITVGVSTLAASLSLFVAAAIVSLQAESLKRLGEIHKALTMRIDPK